MEPLPVRKRRNREHTNSKNGCAQCKVRKVKCDEEKPKCRSCTRRATPCTYANNEGLNQLASAASAASSPYHRSEADSSSYATHQNYGLIPHRSNNVQANGPHARPLPTAAPASLSLNMAHLELFHHFAAVTSYALTVGGTVPHNAWHMTVPQIALSHDFLMHSVLAVAALHIAHLRPEQRPLYWNRAATHQGYALRLQQVAMANPSQENGDALFAFSLLIVYFAFAGPKTSETQGMGIPLDGAVQCINLFRGVRQILPAVKQWVDQGPLAPLLLYNPNNVRSNPFFQDANINSHFSNLLLFCSTTHDPNNDLEDVETFAAAASSLRASFLKFESLAEGDPNTPLVWHWAVRLPESFVQRLTEQQVVPLILVAHWCVLLAQVQQYWWIQGWVDQTLGEIEGCIGQDYRLWLDWPADKIREIRQR